MVKRGLLTVAFLLVANMGYAEYTGPVTDSPRQISVAAAKHLNDGAKISLEGFIIGHLREDYYLFRDESGEIGIEIEADVWSDKQVVPDTYVRVYGELEHESGFIYLEVHRLEISETYPNR